jgi:hypothetical protein
VLCSRNSVSLFEIEVIKEVLFSGVATGGAGGAIAPLWTFMVTICRKILKLSEILKRVDKVINCSHKSLKQNILYFTDFRIILTKKLTLNSE